MKIYRIFLKKTSENKIEDLKMIKNGFDIYALMFQDLYLFYNKMWHKAFLFFFLFIALDFTFNIFLMLIGYLIICSYLALHFTDWKSKQLLDNGYEFLGLCSGKNRREAKEKFLEDFNSNYKEKDKLEQRIF
ncbi:MAG: DUF2628 domain-containing protein [Rickettsiales bacterium]|nr:DUF2628 domain-containing protein [Rickettsiales bacterium]